MKKNLIWTLVSVGGTIVSAIAGLMLYEDKRQEMARQVDAAVDAKLKGIQTNEQQQ